MAHHHVRDPSSLCQSLLSCAALKNVLNKLTKDVSDDFESSSTLFPKDDVGKLQETVSSIRDGLPDVEELAINSEVHGLVLELTEVAYDIEDLLDEAATQRLIMEKKVSGVRDLIPRINNPWKPRRDFASDLTIQIRLLDEIAAKLSYSGCMKSRPANPTFFTETRAALEISSYNQKLFGSVIGREEDKERLIHCILSPSSSTQHPVVINVTGAGGIGKTTLVKLVCNDSRVSSCFDFVSWASYDGSLSYEDGLKRLMNEIKAFANGQRNITSKGISLGKLEDELCSVLQGRRFLLVVDGIRHEILSEWNKYVGLLMVASKGSTVILISWSCIDIRGYMKLFKLQGISERECWSLFQRIAAFDEDADPSLNDIGRSIVNKCGGSTLAVKTLASLLRNNKDPHYWEQIDKSKLWGQCNEAWVSWFISLQRVQVELIPSYVEFFTATDLFVSSTRSRYTSSYIEERGNIERGVDKLVWFWMAQGLLQSTKESADLMEIGHGFFKELMSFIPLAPRDPHLCLLEHDFAESLSAKQTGQVDDRFLPSTRVNLLWTEDMLLPYKFAKVSSTPTCKARTLRVRRSRHDTVSKPFLEGVISNLKHLRVLSIDSFGLVGLPKSIGNLKLLRYLSLSAYNLQALPDSICELVNLQTLEISDCLELKTLPRNMHKLVSMRHLLLSVYNSSTVDKALKGLTLHHLQISILDTLPSFGKGLQYQTGLRTLKIHHCHNVTSLPNSINCLSSLKEFSILNCRRLYLRRWEGLFYLKSLKSLRIEGLPLLSELPDGLQSSADSLEHFVIRYCENLRALPESLELCTRLVDIIIEYCPKLTALPRGIHALKNLQVLKILYCPDLVETVTGNYWHFISHVPIIYLGDEVRRNMDTSTVQERPGPPNLSPSKEIRPASTTSPSEIIPFHEVQSSYLSDYDPPPNPIQHYSVQSQCSALPTAEHPHTASSASPPYGMNIDVEPALAHVIHHPDADATGLEHQGASSNEEAIKIQVPELEKEVEGKRILFLFGEGCEFKKEMLIQLWMALELFTDEEIGGNYFEKLVSEAYILCSVNSFYKVNIGKLNTESDMISDKRNYVILDNGSRNDSASTETLHVSVVCDKVDESLFTTLGRFNKLRILLFLRNYGTRLHEVPRDLLLCYESLVALDLSGSHIKELPSSAEKMINLRYLDLSWTFVELLPERIDHLKMLQTLKLKGCSCLHRLPKELKGLTELRHLDVDVLGQLASFPEGIGALVQLRTLSAFPVGIEEGLKISELKRLDNLTGEFCIAKLENVQSAEEAKGASLTTKRNIKKLELRWSDNQFQELKNEDEAILEDLCPCSDLEEIQIMCFSGASLPGWIADVSFHKLVSITLFSCTHVSVLPSLEKLPALASLELISLNSVANVSFKGEVGLAVFPKLQKLSVDEMLDVESWAEAQEGDYPCLVNVSIKDCPKLPELPSLVYLPSIKYLEVSACTKLAFVPDKELSNSLLQLIVEDCPLIKERCSEMGQVPTIWIDQVKIKTNEDLIEDEDEDEEEDDAEEED